MKFLESSGLLTHIKLNEVEFCMLSQTLKILEKTQTCAIVEVAGARYKLPLCDVESFSNYTVSKSDLPCGANQIPGSIRIIPAAEAILLWLRNASTY
jgi:hypothetical protein